MKKTIVLYILFLLMLVNRSAYAQTVESMEFSAKKGCEFFPIGESGEFIYYCNLLTPSNDKIKVTIEKFRASNLEFVESKEIFPRDFVPEEYVYNKLNCDVRVTLKNSKFYIFYSLVNKKEYTLFAKVVDQNFTSEQNIEIGSFKEKAKGSIDVFQIAFSNDGSKALLVLKKSYFKATQAIGGPMESFYHTEFYGYDMISNKVLFSKILPGELKNLTLNSNDYTIDNKGNIFFLAKLSERRDAQNVLREISIGLLEGNKQECSLKPIDMTNFSSFKGRLEYLENENIMFIAHAGKAIKLMNVSLSDPKLNFEKSLSFSKNSKPETFMELENIALFKDNIYFTFQEKYLKDYYSVSRIFTANVSNTGNILWEKEISAKASSYYLGCARLRSPIDDSGKLNVFYQENIKDDKALNKKYETMMASIDSEGLLTKQTINTDEKIQISGGSSITTSKGDVILLIMRYTNKKMILKKVPSK